MDEAPYRRFGFTPPTGPIQYGYQETLRADFCCKALGDEHWLGLQNPENQHLPALLAYLMAAKSFRDVPRELLDLRQEGASIFTTACIVAVARAHPDDRLFYAVRPRGLPREESPLHIFLPSAATVLQTVRSGWGLELHELAPRLLSLGVEFRLCIQAGNDHPLPRAPRPEMYTGLGFRPAGFKPSKVDYAEYEQLRDQFLRSPRGRAARLAGGILGRLARDVVSDEEVCLGPSTEVFSTGVRLWDGSGPTTYWDDALTEQEVDLICGVYEVATERLDPGAKDGRQKTHISWWPRPRAWLTSGIYTGWWSPDCERWYQRRLEAIGSDSAKPSPQTKWKSHIKFFQEARLVAQANETMAAEFLAQY